jgi:multidrug transporter EmrE-like cation transporter
MFFVGEKIMPSTIVGLLLIIAGIVLQQNWNKHLNIKR